MTPIIFDKNISIWSETKRYSSIALTDVLFLVEHRYILLLNNNFTSIIQHTAINSVVKNKSLFKVITFQ